MEKKQKVLRYRKIISLMLLVTITGWIFLYNLAAHGYALRIQLSTAFLADNSPNSTVKYDVINSSFEVLYSEAAITKLVNSIHKEAKKFVQVGNGVCRSRLPKCLIVGNFKSGTRELIDFMAMHPRIKIRALPYYEVAFFSSNLYAKGLEWYRKQMPCSFENQITVVKSPNDMQSLAAPRRIFAMDPSIRLIVMVREPVSRLVSHITFHKNFLSAQGNSLKKTVLNYRNGEVNKNNFFVMRSIYDEGMEQYLKVFDKSQIKVIEIGEFKQSPYLVLKSVEEFLNLEHTIRPDNFVFNQEKGYFCVRRNNSSITAACYNDNRGRNSTDVKNLIKDYDQIYPKLRSFFKPHNEKFFKLIGRRFAW